MSKSRVAPLTKLTLPQLQLLVASICTRLVHFISGSLKSRFCNLTVKLWSDSKIVLHWLHSSKPLKQFIANRAKEIKKLFPVTVCDHCPTHDNPADLLNYTASHLLSLATWSPVVTISRAMASWNSLQILHLQLFDITEIEDTDATAINAMTMTDRATQMNPAGK